MKTKKFHLGDILSVTTGKLVSPRHMDGVYEILDFMTGQNNFTHMLPTAADRCTPYLFDQFPQLADIDVPKLTEETLLPWLTEQATKYGEYFEVKAI